MFVFVFMQQRFHLDKLVSNKYFLFFVPTIFLKNAIDSTAADNNVTIKKDSRVIGNNYGRIDVHWVSTDYSPGNVLVNDAVIPGTKQKEKDSNERITTTIPHMSSSS